MDWIEKNWFQVCIVTIAIFIAFCLGYYFVYMPNQEDVSTFYQNPSLQKEKNNDPLKVQTNPDGTEIYPVQYNDLWGHEFYTSKIDQTGDINIGSGEKQKIAKIFNFIKIHPAYTKNLVIVLIDPAVVDKTERIIIPWLDDNISVALQPEGGTYQNVKWGSVIALNNTKGFNSAVFTHELGHLIGSKLTASDWDKYYKLRNIPVGTSKNLSEWKLSPVEDFAEVFKVTYEQGELFNPWTGQDELFSTWTVGTKYGVLVPSYYGDDFSSPCYDIEESLINKYKEQESLAVQENEELQNCRRNSSATNIFGGPMYTSEVNEPTKLFIKDVVNRLNS